MKKETKARLLVIKDYLQKWDWSLMPLFMLSEEDAKVIMELITEREERTRKNHEKYEQMVKDAIFEKRQQDED